MTRPRPGGLVLPIAAALLVLTATSPAAADPTIWHPAPCATGEITEHSVDMSGRYPAVSIAGWIQPCAETEQTTGFAVTHHTQRALFVLELEPYESLDAPTRFSLTVPYSPLAFEWWNEFGGLNGLCLARAYEHRLSCVSLEAGTDGTPHVTPVPPDYWGLRIPMLMHPPGGEPITDPNCGTCI